jgi:hypothetical protein
MPSQVGKAHQESMPVPAFFPEKVFQYNRKMNCYRDCNERSNAIMKYCLVVFDLIKF